jgi:hypothetical protein
MRDIAAYCYAASYIVNWFNHIVFYQRDLSSSTSRINAFCFRFVSSSWKCQTTGVV